VSSLEVVKPGALTTSWFKPAPDDPNSRTEHELREPTELIERIIELPESGQYHPPSTVKNIRDLQSKRRLEVPRSAQVPRRVQLLQQWEGVIRRIDSDSFEAEIYDLTEPSKPSEFVELPLTEISEADRNLFMAANVFYWSIGYETRTGGQIVRISEIRLKRMPRWTQKDIQSATAKGQELFNRFARHANEKTGSSGTSETR
jgi:hypothetical protein